MVSCYGYQVGGEKTRLCLRMLGCVCCMFSFYYFAAVVHVSWICWASLLDELTADELAADELAAQAKITLHLLPFRW